MLTHKFIRLSSIYNIPLDKPVFDTLKLSENTTGKFNSISLIQNLHNIRGVVEAEYGFNCLTIEILFAKDNDFTYTAIDDEIKRCINSVHLSKTKGK